MKTASEQYQKSDLLRARKKVKSRVHCTPVLRSSALNSITGAELFFKCENFQKTGSFKARGASHAIANLPDKAQTVITHSSGNHGQALAWAAARENRKAVIVMPHNAPSIKVEAVKAYGGEVIFCEPNLPARESTMQEYRARREAHFIPPYDFRDIILGQSTAAQEMLELIDSPDIVMAPIGGGGLMAGTALSCHHLGKNIEVIGAEPAGADDAFRSFYSGERVDQHQPNTICDGLLTTLGERNFELIRSHVHQVLLAPDTTIIRAMRQIWERMKIVIEPSCAVPLAAILEHPRVFKNKKVGIILSGGNVDLQKLPF